MRYIHFDVSSKESYSLDSVGKHGFGRFFISPKKSSKEFSTSHLHYCFLPAAMEIGPQPHGVVRSNIYTVMKSGVQHMLDWVRFFNSGATGDQWNASALPHIIFSATFFPAGTIFEGEYVDVFTMVKHIDYPRDRETGNIIAAVHPRLQVRPRYSNKERTPLFAQQLIVPWCRFTTKKLIGNGSDMPSHINGIIEGGFDWKWTQTII